MTDGSKKMVGKITGGRPDVGATPPGCPESAACRTAVTRTYERLRRGGADDRVAFEAAEAVYAWHHPDVPRARVPFVIADWLP